MSDDPEKVQFLDPRIPWAEILFENRILKGVGPYKTNSLHWQRYMDWSFPNFKLVYHQMARGCDKTYSRAFWTLLAGLSIDHGNFFAAGEDKENARLFRDAAKWIILKHPQLFSDYKAQKYDVVNKKNGTLLRILASDEVGNYGLTPDLIVLNDFHAWGNQGFWDALFTSMGKRAHSRLWVESNALSMGTPQYAWVNLVRERAKTVFLTEGRDEKGQLEIGPLGQVINGPKWFYHCPHYFPATWQWHMVPEWRASMIPSSFERLINNRDVTDGNQFLTEEQVTACEVSDKPLPLPKGRRLTGVFVDIGYAKDGAICATMSIDSEGIIHLNNLRVWTAQRAEPVQIFEVVTYANLEAKRVGAYYKMCDPYEMQMVLQEDQTWKPFTMNATSLRKITEFMYQDVSQKKIKLYRRAGPALQSKGVRQTEWTLKREMVEAVMKEMPYGQRVDHRAGGFNDRITAVGMGIVTLREGFRPIKVNRASHVRPNTMKSQGMARLTGIIDRLLDKPKQQLHI